MTRRLVATLLVVLAAVFAVLSLIAGFIRYQALDNETFEQTASELIADDDIRAQVAATLVDQLYSNVDVAAALEERLPPEQERLAAPIAAVTRELADRGAVRLLNRPRAQQVWVSAASGTHRQLLRALDDELAVLRTEEGLLILNVRPLIVQLGEQVGLIARINERLPEDAGEIVVMEAGELETAQDITQLLKVVATFIWIIPFALAAAALWVARGRRRETVRALGIAAVVTGLVVLVIRGLAGDYVVEDLVVSPSVRPAARDAWEILTRQLADGGWTLIAIGLVLFLGAWLAGRSRRAVSARERLAPWLEQPEYAFGVPAAAMLLLVWWGPTVQLRRWYLVLALALALAIGIEALRRVVAASEDRSAAVAPDSPAAGGTDA